MKKLVAITMILVLCLGLSIGVAETADTEEIPSITNEVSFEAQDFAIAETGMTLKMPADWTQAVSEDGSTVVFTSPDGKIAMNVNMTATDLETVYSQCAQLVTDGKAKEFSECYINDNYYIVLNVDETTSAAYAYVDESMTLTIAFVATDAESSTAYSPIIPEILGSLALPADAE